MARFSAGVLTGVGSTTLPIFSIYSAAAPLVRLREMGIYNTGAAAVSLKLVRVSTTGTQGTNLVEAPTTTDTSTALATAWSTHTVAPTLGNDLGYRCYLPVGGSTIWTWEDYSFVVSQAANAGIALIVENGTGQACQVYLNWQE